MIRVLLAVACTAWIGTAAAETLSVQDDTGREVRLHGPARHIVTLAPHATELAVAAGASAQLVAIAVGHEPAAELRHLPRVGGPGALDRERLLALRPDLVIAWQSGNRPSDLDWITHSGIALFRSEPRTLADVSRAIRAVGTLAGRQQDGMRGAAAFDAALQTPCIDLPRLPVYVEVWDRPAMSLGGSHWLNAVLHAAGWKNILTEYPYGVIPLAAETMIGAARLPQVSLLRRHDDSTADHLADLLSRPGPRLAEAVQLLCRRRLQIVGGEMP